MGPLALLWALAASCLLAAPAQARPVVVYPRDGTAVTMPNINVYGAATERVEVVKIRANEQTLIPFIRNNRTFEQSIRLRPGLNEVQVGEYVIRIAFVTPKQPAPEGFVARPVHQAIVKDCASCHTLAKAGDFARKEVAADLCLGCHADPSLSREGTTLKVVHGPVSDDRDCLSCHDPHGGLGRGLLRKAGPSLCYDCHDSVVEGKDFVHSPVADGECLSCHRPHASANRALLSADGNALCLDCHDDPAAGLSAAHDAMDEGCASCHDPHASAYRGLLRKTQAEVCGACHDVPKPAKGIVVHSPIADDRECTVCHSPHGGKADKFLSKAVPALCNDCHDDVAAVKAGGSVHPPAEEGSCGDCHVPHSGPPGLLVKARSALCLDCHDRFAAPEGGSLHPPAGDGECADCHAPHAAAGKALLKASGADLCYECHDRFKGKMIHSPVEDGACTDCHLPHASENAGLLVKAGMGLCLQCHDDPTLVLLRNPNGSVHGPIKVERSCTPCHSPHAGTAKLLRAAPEDFCGICHGSVMRKRNGEEFAFRHSPVRNGRCLDCHRAHSSTEPRLLAGEPNRTLCLGCHKDPGVNLEGRPWKTPHPPVLKGCGECHMPHASDEKGVLRSSQITLCGKCHPDHSLHSLDATRSIAGKKSMARMPAGFPIQAESNLMLCSGCHLAHGSDYESMFNMPKDWLCRKCHTF